MACVCTMCFTRKDKGCLSGISVDPVVFCVIATTIVFNIDGLPEPLPCYAAAAACLS
jgi:hypothetical protein